MSTNYPMDDLPGSGGTQSPIDDLLSLGEFNLPKPKERTPMDRLKADDEKHDEIRDRLLEMLHSSERKMSDFYSRWQANERRVQAYIDLPDFEEQLRLDNESGKPPAVTSIVIPYAFSTRATIATYLLQTFVGAKPYFQIDPSTPENASSAHLMEQVLQYNADYIKFVKKCKQWIEDAADYGVGVIRTAWRSEERPRTVRYPNGDAIKEQMLAFEGTDVMNVDPFRFFPDPRVAMCDVNEKGDFVFWRTFISRSLLKIAEEDGYLFDVDRIVNRLPENYGNWDYGGSARNERFGGEAHPAERGQYLGYSKLEQFVQLDQGSVFVIPAQWGLGKSTKPEKWFFTIANRDRIIQAEPLHCDHDRHPVCVIEPWGNGYGFGQPGLVDYLGPFQDSLSSMHNLMMHNNRSANNMFAYDPWAFYDEDIKNPGPFKMFPLRPQAMGRDPKTAIFQIPFNDVTKDNLPHMDILRGMGDDFSGATDALRGAPPPSRTPAQTTRIMTQAGASRLAVIAQNISSQGMWDLRHMMVMNTLQYMSPEFYVNIVGSEGWKYPLLSMTGQPFGPFTYPTSDGTIPFDKQFLLEQWKEIFQTILADGELRYYYNMPEIVERLATISGIKDIARFRQAPQQLIDQQVQAGNYIPTGQTGEALQTPAQGEYQ